MSKERLEEIREEVEMLRGDMCVTSIEVDTSADSILDDMEWLIEQAARVPELEGDKKALGDLIEKTAKKAWDIEQQNKRYREHLRRLQRAATRYPAEDMAYV